jgi:hypothetical protein
MAPTSPRTTSSSPRTTSPSPRTAHRVLHITYHLRKQLHTLLPPQTSPYTSRMGRSSLMSKSMEYDDWTLDDARTILGISSTEHTELKVAFMKSQILGMEEGLHLRRPTTLDNPRRP